MAVATDTFTSTEFNATWEARIESIDFQDRPKDPPKLTVTWGNELVSGDAVINGTAALYLNGTEVATQNLGQRDQLANPDPQTFTNTTEITSASQGDTLEVIVYGPSVDDPYMVASTTLPAPDPAPEPTITCSKSTNETRTGEGVSFSMTIENPFDREIQVYKATWEIGWYTLKIHEAPRRVNSYNVPPNSTETFTESFTATREGVFNPTVTYEWDFFCARTLGGC